MDRFSHYHFELIKDTGKYFTLVQCVFLQFMHKYTYSKSCVGMCVCVCVASHEDLLEPASPLNPTGMPM